MTVERLGRTTAPRFTLVGTCAASAVRHVGLLAESGAVAVSEKARVHHMGPPLELPGAMDAHVVGWLDDLESDEAVGLADWLAEVRTLVCPAALVGAAGYIAHPSAVRDEVTGRTVTWRYSCVGFVATAYRDGAGVQLLVDDGELPEADRALLERVWSRREVALGARYGLDGAGPWRVLLPGYLFRALEAGRTNLPYRPALADAELP